MKKSFLILLLGVILYAWAMILVPLTWVQVLKATGPMTIETSYKWGEKSLWRDPYQKVFPEVNVPTIVWGKGGNEVGVGLYPPKRPIHAASQKMNIKEPWLGWKNTPIICWWHLDEVHRLWWGDPIHWDIIYG